MPNRWHILFDDAVIDNFRHLFRQPQIRHHHGVGKTDQDDKHQPVAAKNS